LLDLTKGVNRLQLTAKLHAIGQLRYTPAGMPALDVDLLYEGRVNEAGQLRSLNMALGAVALGSMAERLSQLTLGCSADFSGFLAPKSIRQTAKQTVFHIQDFQITNEGESHAWIQKI
jgi:primosomal replication protein N